MKKFVLAALILLLLAVPAMAGDQGPSINSVVNSILRVVPETGAWHPQEKLWFIGLTPGAPLKVNILDNSGKVVAYAVYSYQQKENGPRGTWFKTNEITKYWPDGGSKNLATYDGDFDKLKPLAVGSYKMQVLSGGKVIWETPFQVNNVIDSKHKRHNSANHFYVSGPWKDLASVRLGRGSRGIIVSWWSHGPRIPVCYNQSNMEIAGSLRAEVAKDGKVILKENMDGNNAFYLKIWQVARHNASISHQSEVKREILANDGDYTITVFIQDSDSSWHPVVKLNMPIRGGKLAINEKLSGDTSNPKTRIIGEKTYFEHNQVKKPFEYTKK